LEPTGWYRKWIKLLKRVCDVRQDFVSAYFNQADTQIVVHIDGLVGVAARDLSEPTWLTWLLMHHMSLNKFPNY
jgi:hypothetical protein